MLTTNSIMNNLIILQVKLSGWGDYDLTAYYPIPITTLDNAYINGPTEVIYLSNGEPTFSKEPYKLFINGEVDETATWSIYPTESTDKFIGQIKYNDKKKEYRLSPMNFYVDGVSTYGVQGKQGSNVVWSQPILVVQNKYPSAMVNKWDGQLNIDSDNNFIGVAQIAAGKKENNNTFTGVLMGSFGDSNVDSSLSKNTGVYGYYQGKQVYALKDDGTATFGKSGNGQIEIKGDSGKIKSAGYDNGNGLLIDLKDSKIDGKSNSNSVFLLNKTSPYLKITDPINNVILMNIGSDSYYLQSKNYTSSTGTYFNLATGNITTNSITVNSGTFKDDIIINYTGSTGSGWTYGDQSLNYILDQIGKAAKEASDLATASIQWTQDIANAQRNAEHDIEGISNTVDMLNQFFEIGASIDKSTGYVSYGSRPSFVSPNGGSVSVGYGVELLGNEINIGYSYGSSTVNFHGSTIYITKTVTLEDYIRQIAKS